MPEIITRRQALDRGLIRYFTGKPCKRGHLIERLASSANCLECHRLAEQTPARKAANILYQGRLRAMATGDNARAGAGSGPRVLVGQLTEEGYQICK